MINKEKAIGKLNQQIAATSELKKKACFSPEFKKWERDTRVLIQKIFGEETTHKRDFSNIQFSLSIASTSTPDSAWQKAYQNGLDDAKAILQSFIDEVNDYWDDVFVDTDRDYLSIVEKVCHRFHLVVRQLRSRYDNRDTLDVKDEYDVQDLLHALLTLEFDDIRAEEWVPSYAGSSSRMDFLLKREKIVIEVKKTRDRLRTKEVGEQLIIDISRYRTHPDCQTLICFVYDPEGQIANPRGLENDLSGEKDGLSIKVMIAPKCG